uniref:Uncharacterized protein n=1 Tax=Aegilops tauschii subsp. strangulata TaxID=200361 RepID=A0A453C9R8_AEGTS
MMMRWHIDFIFLFHIFSDMIVHWSFNRDLAQGTKRSNRHNVTKAQQLSLK